jgi:branched-chain amino acid transport system permease protein
VGYFLARNGVFLAVLLVVPIFAGQFWAYQLGLYYLYAIAALGIGVAWGQAGIVPLGQGLFVALSAYLAGFVLIGATNPIVDYLGIVGAALAAAALAFVIAMVVLRGREASGASFSLITLALTLVGAQVAGSWISVTGGFNGLQHIPGLPGIDGFMGFYYLVAVVLALAVAGVSWLNAAPIGTLWRAGADNEQRLAFFGYGTTRLKAVAFAVSAALAGLAGGLYAPQQNLVTPDLAGFIFSGNLLVYAAIGGRTNVLGPVLGTLAISILASELRDRFPWWELVIGLLFIVVVLRAPGGMIGAFAPLTRRLMRPPRRLPRLAPPKTWAAPMLAVAFEDVRVRIGDVTVLDGLDLATAEERFLCLIGPNGAGKTSTLNVLTGALPRTSGRIVVDGREVPRPTPAALALRGIGRKFQTPAVFPQLTVQENLAVALWAGRVGWADLLRPNLLAWTSPVLTEMQRRFAFLGRGTASASSLSHGERQILELTMALLSEPRLLLLDEPCAGLSREETTAVIDAIVWAQGELGFRVMIIEHDMELVRRLADRVVVLHQGAFLADGTVAAVQANPQVQAVYVGGTR